MVENVGRSLTFVVLLCVGSLLLLTLLPEPFRLGLDLRGGTRLVYSFDIQQAIEDNPDLLAPGETEQDLLQQQVEIIRSRIDPTGVKEPMIRAEGTNRIVIELPETVSKGDRPSTTLGEELTPENVNRIVLDPTNTNFELFPAEGGDIDVGGESIDYGAREENVLLGLSRPLSPDQRVVHGADTKVELRSGDPIRDRIENLGQLQFMMVLSAGAIEFDETAERTKFETWQAANPGVDATSFNVVPPAEGGPSAGVLWYPQAEFFDRETGQVQEQPPIAMVKPSPENTFDGADLDRVWLAMDDFGGPAVGFEMKPSVRGRFGDWTDENSGRQMAIILNGVVETAPRLEEGGLYGSSRITGYFTNDEVKDLITVLRTGSLRIQPTLEDEEVVGPTLGAAYVKRGMYAGILGLLAVLTFMGAYYRRLGVFSMISLLAAMLMLLGGMAFMQSTLTLPGIAGIVLTIGMAVDANILIFDRIREEGDKGRNIKQSAKNGFQNATSAILDANITTFLTAVILYNVGTGPIRGFAVTLMVGIVTSVIAALILTRLLVHFSLEKGTKKFAMGAWMANANFKFLDKSKIALGGSLLFIVAGLGAFVIRPDFQKFGIDFLGGFTMQVRTAEPQSVETIQDRLADLAEEIQAPIEVKGVLSEAAGDGLFNSFRITYKTSDTSAAREAEMAASAQEAQAAAEGGSADADADSEPDDASAENTDEGGGNAKTTYSNRVQTALRDLLQPGPVEATLADGVATVTLYFEEPHTLSDIDDALALAGYPDLEVQETGESGVYVATGTVGTTSSNKAIEDRVKQQFTNAKDSLEVAYTLSLPVPDSALVSGQVVGELRNSAVMAILVSLFAIVLYIRVRFAEYSYGFAAVAALTHDVLVTLGVITFVSMTGLLRIEINLPMIAAFMTIIGYSLNDTIVVFDRVRENLPRTKGDLKTVLDLSLNQTLSRTIMTSMTTLIAVTLLFAFSAGTGNVLEGFSFAMLVGVLVGTYSSMFIAAPVLHALETRAQARSDADGGGGSRVARAETKPREATV